MTSTPHYVEVVKLSKRFSRFGRGASALSRLALDDADLSLVAGSVNALVGESGSGKTTLGRCLLRFTEPTAGLVRVGDHMVFSENEGAWSRDKLMEFRRINQMIFQNPADCLNPRRTVRFSLEEPLIVHRLVPRAHNQTRCEELLRLVDLGGDLLERFPHQISGGQRQRVVIARALASDPRFVVADEPTSALDISQRNEIADLLVSVTSRMGRTLLVITHDMALVHRLAEHVFVLYAGRVVESGPTTKVFSNPLHPYTQDLLTASRVLFRRGVVHVHSESVVKTPVKSIEHWRGRCAYVVRCRLARPVCFVAPPITGNDAATQGHAVACHLMSPTA
ncbi:MAG: ABC transporter ATP-binding protein [Myxococcales bacterium]|nr:ABC transporter ATP-binding protein [Myxococcales bacterium]